MNASFNGATPVQAWKSLTDAADIGVTWTLQWSRAITNFAWMPGAQAPEGWMSEVWDNAIRLRMAGRWRGNGGMPTARSGFKRPRHPTLRIASRMIAMQPMLGSAVLILEACADVFDRLDSFYGRLGKWMVFECIKSMSGGTQRAGPRRSHIRPSLTAGRLLASPG